MQVIPVTAVHKGFGTTSRKDNWWAAPLGVFLGLLTFLIYVHWAMFQGEHYTFGPYLSPFYAPELWGSSPHAWFGPLPPFWPSFIPFSPALLILPFPAGFRFTCYYYRGAYYKSFWADPVACAVGEPRKSYLGENSFPLIIQNIHRYFLYAALVFIFLLSYDVWLAMWWPSAADPNVKEFGIGLGTLIMATNVVLIGGYTLGCHSLRHLVGGRKNEVSKSPVSDACYSCTSNLNNKHQLFAWASLISVMLTDVYIRLCSMGILSDPRLL
jgi:hypothetical protein